MTLISFGCAMFRRRFVLQAYSVATARRRATRPICLKPFSSKGHAHRLLRRWRRGSTVLNTVIVYGHPHQQRLVRAARGKLSRPSWRRGFADLFRWPTASQAQPACALRYAQSARHELGYSIQEGRIRLGKAGRLAEDNGLADWAHALRTGCVPDAR